MSSEYEFIQEFVTKEKAATPSYVFDLDSMKEYVKKVQSCLGERVQLCYAMKANPFLTGPMMEVVSSFEVCSPGEFRICERTGVPMERIVLSGVYKNPQDVEYVISTYGGKGIYTIESVQHLQLLNDMAVKAGQKISVLIRVTSGNQFGVDETEIRRMISQRDEYPGVQIQGLQFYSGTQKKDLAQMKEELNHLDEFLRELKETAGFQGQILEYGPGFFVPYFKKDRCTETETVLAEFKKILDELAFKGNIVLEMGRFLAAFCGYYITSIVDMKVNKEQPYVILDGGINHLNYFGQAMAMKQPYCKQLASDGTEKTEGEEELWNLCGALCTVSDVIVKRFPLRKPSVHDILVFERVGAYSVTEGIYLFLSRPLPRIYFWTKKDGLKLVRDNVHTDLLNSEK
ncbi:MAG: alanine racemase [Clostridia bacterium]|nr:alanine racemase [Clostridia bacterium]MDY5553824.1 alanine racemase [Blautia sp.]